MTTATTRLYIRLKLWDGDDAEAGAGDILIIFQGCGTVDYRYRIFSSWTLIGLCLCVCNGIIIYGAKSHISLSASRVCGREGQKGGNHSGVCICKGVVVYEIFDVFYRRRRRMWTINRVCIIFSPTNEQEEKRNDEELSLLLCRKKNASRMNRSPYLAPPCASRCADCICIHSTLYYRCIRNIRTTITIKRR